MGEAAFACPDKGPLVQGHLGGGALRVGFPVPGSLAENFLAHQHMNCKDGLVVRTVRRNQLVARSWQAQALDQFLQA